MSGFCESDSECIGREQEIARLTRERDEALARVEQLMPIVRAYARKFPRWMDRERSEQDPMGAHAIIDAHADSKIGLHKTIYLPYEWRGDATVFDKAAAGGWEMCGFSYNTGGAYSNRDGYAVFRRVPAGSKEAK